MSAGFVERHIGVSPAAREMMLREVGVSSLDDLMSAAVPASIAGPVFSGLIPDAVSEPEVLDLLRTMASQNRVRRSLIGQGYYGTHTPSVISRNVLENPAWYTAYTPYQPEISQGRLEALLTFQTMIADLTGMATANASMLDEATAAAEGMLLARRASSSESNVFVVDADVFDHTLSLLQGRAEPLGITVVVADLSRGDQVPDCFGVLVQCPSASGRVWDPRDVISAAQSSGAIAVVAADLLSLTLMTSPGEQGADVVIGSSQRFGVPLGYGGPHAGFLAVRAGLERSLPGRLVGVTRDANGEPAYRLTLQAREQHIRREKATSNICTAQVLLAVMAGMYAVYHGPEGLRAIAEGVRTRADRLARGLIDIGVSVGSEHIFDTISVVTPHAASVVEALADRGYLVWRRGDELRLSLDETTTDRDVDEILEAWKTGGLGAEGIHGPQEMAAWPTSMTRTSDYLSHAVFHDHRSETRMMRYLRRLADFDLALDRGMIPLGSCTMKLNSATEMAAVTWSEFSGVHPFAPAEDTTGYDALLRDLESWLADVTGYDSVSLQPNAGSQGELAGLMAIRQYHVSRGDDQRTICLIPSSAHGTNAASAVLAGMSVVVVACDDLGNVDLDDLRAQIATAGNRLAALMITYPSTHGVYEHEVPAVTAEVHAAGGQVYVDGANMNAMTGFARFGDLGGDVSHLNLHKTFCIPHGGGGPGVGPVAAKAHLAPFLPGHGGQALPGRTLLRDGRVTSVDHGGPQISAAPFGSPSILPISWAYVRLMGLQGLREATAQAVLSANYVAARLRHAYPILYTGENGFVAHECILDLRPLTAATGITVDDVAKRLIDFGFHAPTMSFPVAGTLMVEPTESEDLDELDRFVAAMLAIHAEAHHVSDGVWPSDNNPLVNAPHTAFDVAGDWNHPYSREIAAYPFAVGQHSESSVMRVRSKYWPPVRRVDNAFGDRNLQCACPPPEAFVSASPGDS